MSYLNRIFGIPNRKKRTMTPIPIPIPISEVPANAPPNRNPSLIAQNVNPIGMSYWRNINAHAGQDILRIILSIDNQLNVFTVAKNNLQVLNQKDLGIPHTGEGVFFSISKPDIIYIPYDDHVDWFDVMTGQSGTVFVSASYKIWQLHCDVTEKIWSMTLKDNNYNVVGWGVWDNGNFKSFDIIGNPDECQIDKSGKYLVIKEDNDNRIIHLSSGSIKILSNLGGALGHSDCGYECMLGENDYSSLPGALDVVDLGTGIGHNIFSTGIWNMGYVSFSNAQPIPLEQQKCLITTPSELISVRLDGSAGEIICSNLTESQEYENRPKANLDPYGQFAVWTAFVAGSLNCYLVRL